MWTQVYFRSGFFRYGNAINQMSFTESGTAEDQTIWGNGGTVKPNYFKKQCFSYHFYLYSRVHISSDTAFLKILKKPSIVQE